MIILFLLKFITKNNINTSISKTIKTINIIIEFLPYIK
jgi:hypothetical protein